MHRDYIHACIAGVKSATRDLVLQFIQSKNILKVIELTEIGIDKQKAPTVN